MTLHKNIISSLLAVTLLLVPVVDVYAQGGHPAGKSPHSGQHVPKGHPVRKKRGKVPLHKSRMNGTHAGNPDSAGASNSDADEMKKIMEFADNLFDEKDYYRAITEYKRFIFMYPENPLALNAKYKIGLSYQKGGRLKDAAGVFLNLSTLDEKGGVTKKALFKLAEVYFEDGRYIDSSEAYRRFLMEYPDTLESENAKYRLSWSYLYDEQYDKAKEGFDGIPEGSAFHSMAKNVSIEMDEIVYFKEKSPHLAGSLSAIIPGAGQLYCGNYQDAAASFILNGLFIWATVEAFEQGHNATGGVLAFFSLMWYSGNIYSAVSSAHKYNRDNKKDILERIDSKYNLSYGFDGGNKANYLVFNYKF